MSRCARPTGSPTPTPPSAGRGRGAVARSVRQARRRSARRDHGLRHVGARARRPDRPRAPARACARTAGQWPNSSPPPPNPLPRRVSPPTTACCRRARWDTVDELIDNLLAVFAAGASLVQVTNPDPAAHGPPPPDREDHQGVAGCLTRHSHSTTSRPVEASTAVFRAGLTAQSHQWDIKAQSGSLLAHTARVSPTEASSPRLSGSSGTSSELVRATTSTSSWSAPRASYSGQLRRRVIGP